MYQARTNDINSNENETVSHTELVTGFD